jgi:hypothetical protein
LPFKTQVFEDRVDEDVVVGSPFEEVGGRDFVVTIETGGGVVDFLQDGRDGFLEDFSCLRIDLSRFPYNAGGDGAVVKFVERGCTFVEFVGANAEVDGVDDEGATTRDGGGERFDRDVHES